MKTVITPGKFYERLITRPDGSTYIRTEPVRRPIDTNTPGNNLAKLRSKMKTALKRDNKADIEALDKQIKALEIVVAEWRLKRNKLTRAESDFNTPLAARICHMRNSVRYYQSRGDKASQAILQSKLDTLINERELLKLEKKEYKSEMSFLAIKGLTVVKSFNKFDISKVLSSIYISKDIKLPTSLTLPKSRKRLKQL